MGGAAVTKCPKCGENSVIQHITTRLYNGSVPIVVSRHRCLNCQWFEAGDTLKRFFCRSCGSLTMSREGVCGPCRGYHNKERVNKQ